MTIYYTAYIITNLVNGKRYAGVHKTNDLNDRYMGSGSLLKKAITKYGLNNFHKEIIQFFESENDMYLWESNFVTEEKVHSTDWYNLRTGGSGGFRLHPDLKKHLSESRKGKPGKPHTDETKAKLSKLKMGRKTGKASWNRGKTHSEYSRALISKKNYERFQKLSSEERKKIYGRSGSKNNFFGRTHSEEVRSKISQTALAKIECERCGIVSNRINYHRYHGEKCGTTHNTCVCEYCNLNTTPGNYKRWHGENCKHKTS